MAIKDGALDRLNELDRERIRNMGFRVPGKPQSKYRNKRTEYGGVLYDSKAEAEEAKVLDSLLQFGDLAWWLRQVWIPLGPDFGTKVDFLVGRRCPTVPAAWNRLIDVSAREVKGAETREFKRVKKLWPKYAPFSLVIIRGGCVKETIEGAR